MAVKDGMLAIAKVLKVLAVASACACLFAGSFYGGFPVAATLAVLSFLSFWTPAWVIRKFVQ